MVFNRHYIYFVSNEHLIKTDAGTTTLYRPVGPKELALIAASGFREFPPRLPEQPIFYPVLSEEYARQIAKDWNVPASGSGVRAAVCPAKAVRGQIPCPNGGRLGSPGIVDSGRGIG